MVNANSNSWRDQFSDDDEFRDLDAQAEQSGFLVVPNEATRDESKSLDSANASNPTPEIPGYSINDLVGHGGSSDVYSAVRLKDHRQFAVKFFYNSTSEFRIRREVDALKRFDHAHIPRFHEWGTTPHGRSFVVMDFVNGTSIDEYCEKKGLSKTERVKLMLPLCDALSHVHDRGVVHRDLKPSNILVDQNGVPFLTDFGLAKSEDPTVENEGQYTKTGALLGTLNYLAPERVAKAKGLSERAVDVFGLGAILHVLLSGRPPFQFSDVVEVFACYDQQYPVRLPETAQVPIELEAICIKALAANPERRYSTPEEFRDDLRNFLAGRPVVAKRQLFRERLDQLWRLYPNYFRLGVTALLLVAVSMVIVLSFWQQAVNAKKVAFDATHQRDVALESISELVRRMDERPETLSDRKRLLEIVSETYGDLRAESVEQIDLVRNVANTNFKLGQVSHHLADREQSPRSFQKALQAFESILDVEPGDEEALFSRFHSLLALTRYEEARDAISELVRLRPDNEDYFDAYFTCITNLIRDRHSTGDFEGTAELQAEVFQLLAQNGEATDLRGTRRECHFWFQVCRGLIAAGKLEQATAKMKRSRTRLTSFALEEQPTSGELEEYFSFCSLEVSLLAFQNNGPELVQLFDELKSYYDKAQSRYPNFQNFRWHYVMCLYEYGRWLKQSPGGEMLLNTIQREFARVLDDWDSLETENADFIFGAHAYYRLFSEVPLTAKDRQRLEQINQTIAAMSLEQLPNYFSVEVVTAPRSPRLVDWVRHNARTPGSRIISRWVLSRANGIDPHDPEFLPSQLTDQQRLQILAESCSYSMASIDNIVELRTSSLSDD